jgi:hypothetical protein
VYLTNGSVDNPWAIVDGYDDRSWIENGLFRNSKQFWRLTHWFPEKNEAGVRSHMMFVMLMFAVATAYRLWSKEQAGVVAKIEDHQIEATTYRIVAVDTGEITEAPAPGPETTTHLASTVMFETTDETTEKLSADQQPDVLAHNLLGGQGAERWRRQLIRENRDKVIVFIGQTYGIFDTHEFLVLTGVPLRALPPGLGSREDILRRYGCEPGPPQSGPASEPAKKPTMP